MSNTTATTIGYLTPIKDNNDGNNRDTMHVMPTCPPAPRPSYNRTTSHASISTVRCDYPLDLTVPTTIANTATTNSTDSNKNKRPRCVSDVDDDFFLLAPSSCLKPRVSPNTSVNSGSRRMVAPRMFRLQPRSSSRDNYNELTSASTSSSSDSIVSLEMNTTEDDDDSIDTP